ncbi:MAG: hypothetical protein K2Y37_13460 [Pirellulales bacterium]|nr:hypothetical protein [Pirellulales bacterium]
MPTARVAKHRANAVAASTRGWAGKAPTRLALAIFVGLSTSAAEVQAKHVGPVNTMFRWIGVCYSVGYHAQECCPCAAAGQPLYGSPCAQGYLNPQPRGPIVLQECDHGMYSPSHLYWQGGDTSPYQGEMITAPTEVTAPAETETTVPTDAAPANDPPPAGPDEAEPAPEPAPAPSASSPRGPRYRSTKSSRSVSGARSSRSANSRGQRYVPGPSRSSAVQSR